MPDKKRTFEYRLDFLYQSIAVYAGTLVLYLLVRGEFFDKQFPIVWQDPILGLLSIIILFSIGALGYNLAMRRRVVLEDETLHFVSAVRDRKVERSDVLSVLFGRERSSGLARGMRVVRIRLRDRRRSIRIYPHKFSGARSMVEALRAWAGPLARERSSRLVRKRMASRKLRRPAGNQH